MYHFFHVGAITLNVHVPLHTCRQQWHTSVLPCYGANNACSCEKKWLLWNSKLYYETNLVVKTQKKWVSLFVCLVKLVLLIFFFFFWRKKLIHLFILWSYARVTLVAWKSGLLYAYIYYDAKFLYSPWSYILVVNNVEL